MLSEDAFVILGTQCIFSLRKDCKQVYYSVCVKEERKPKATREALSRAAGKVATQVPRPVITWGIYFIPCSNPSTCSKRDKA